MYQSSIVNINDVSSFYKTDEEFGGFSNMCGNFPLIINGIRIPHSEGLYQSCRFPGLDNIQKIIISEKSPISSKMKSKKYKEKTREDWDEVRVDIMRWCLEVKYCYHSRKFDKLFEKTEGRDIVEISHKDKFWGMMRQKGNKDMLEGQNVLGKLLMELRSKVQEGNLEKLFYIESLDIENFVFMGEQIRDVDQLFKVKSR